MSTTIITPYVTEREGWAYRSWVLHAPDGTELAVFDSEAEALDELRSLLAKRPLWRR